MTPFRPSLFRFSPRSVGRPGLRALSLGLIGLLVPATLLAQVSGATADLDPELPIVRAARVQGSIHLDGILDEADWSRAEPATTFTQLDPWEGEPASEETRVYVLYDESALYIGAVLKDRYPVSTRLGRRDGFLMDSDRFSVSLDPYNDHRTGVVFEVNPSGVRSDEALSNGRDEHGDRSWDPVWEAAAHVDEDGWTAELRIPFSQLRFRSGPEQVWGIQFTREIARNREKQLFSFTPKDQAGGIARFGHLVGLTGIHQSRGLELLPYVQGKAEYVQVDQREDVGFKNPFRDGSDYFWGTGVDLKYRLSSNLTLDATINPDFGQVEVDPAVVNLTAFETRYQEKRPFFVEGAGIFSFGQGGGGRGGGGGGGMGGMFGFGRGGGGSPGGGPTQLLYSRRIGEPPRGSAPEGSVYTDIPEATTILGAAKLTGQTGGGWSIGLLEAVTAREMAPFVDEARVHGEAEVAPLANFFVARVKRDLRRGQSVLGAIATAVNRNLDGSPLAEDLRSSAYAAGLDFLHEWSDRAWSLSGQFAASRIGGDPAVIEAAQRSSARYFQRPDAHHIELDPTLTSMSGYSASLSLRRQAGLHWRGSVELSATSPGYEVNDLGFQSSADRRRAEVQIEYQENRPGETFRRYEVSMSPEVSWNFNGDRLDTSLSFRSNFTFLNYWSVFLNYERGFESTDDRLTRGGPLALKPASHQVSLNGSSDFSKPYTFRASARLEWDAAGRREQSYSLGVGLKPNSQWDISLGPRLSFNHSVAQYVEDVEDPLASHTFGARYVFADLDQTTFSMETRLNVTFTPNLTLELYAQPFMASGDYGTLKELAAPGTFDFVRYGIDRGTASVDENRNTLIDPDGGGPAESFTVYNRDFNRVSLRGTGVLRWEWRPGSTLFLVWQQSRSDYYREGNFELSRDLDALVGGPSDNIFMIKATYWLGS